MRRTILSAAFLAAITAGGLSTMPAGAITPLVCSSTPCPVIYMAQNGLTITNNGSNICLQPGQGCALFSDALSEVTDGGTLFILDGGTYFQSVNITKSVTIVGPQHPTIVAPMGSPAIAVNGANVVFALDGVNLDGELGGSAGISATNAANVAVKDSLIKNFTTGGPIVAGIDVRPNSGVTIGLTVERLQTQNNSFGIVADGRSGGTVNATVSDSVISDNTQYGIAAVSSGTNAWFLVDQTMLTGNGTGLAANGSGAAVAARNTSVFKNTTGLLTQNTGTLTTYGTNSVNGNATNGSFTHALPLQ